MNKFYDQQHDRLVMLASRSNADFWDGHWQNYDLREMMRSGLRNNFIRRHTQRFLSPEARVLEGGCGLGQNVYALSSWGFEAHGVDYAKDTVEKVREACPELRITTQDVRKLDFPDNYFDGYWSLGVIEHFFNGFGTIIKEAQRVLRPGGVLFITFPYISPLRRMKIRRKAYPIRHETGEPKDFYQFVLDGGRVTQEIERLGFSLVLKQPWDATKGLMDEIPSLRGFLGKIYASQNIFARGVRFLNAVLFGWLAGHVILLVFRKK